MNKKSRIFLKHFFYLFYFSLCPIQYCDWYPPDQRTYYCHCPLAVSMWFRVCKADWPVDFWPMANLCATTETNGRKWCACHRVLSRKMYRQASYKSPWATVSYHWLWHVLLQYHYVYSQTSRTNRWFLFFNVEKNICYKRRCMLNDLK